MKHSIDSYQEVERPTPRIPTSPSAALGQGILVVARALGIASLRGATTGFVWAASKLRGR
ncbi:MAG TPA: hypothetical protein VFM68_00605 [Candidatus Saccharimonadales bacterium]|nr:hypothetical protein [Candidatus Saccharimonadales bacterium]